MSKTSKRPDPKQSRSPRGQGTGPGGKQTKKPGAQQAERPAAQQSRRPGGVQQTRKPDEKKKARKFVRLEFLRMELEPDGVWHKLFDPNVGWDMYFLLQVEHPTDPRKTIGITWPQRPISVEKDDENVIKFGHQERGGREGAEVYYGPLPEDEHVKVDVWAIQSKQKQRNTGEVLRKVSSFVDKDVVGSLGLDKAPNVWVQAAVIANRGAGLLGEILDETGDKDRGHQSLSEEFDDRAFKTEGRVGRKVSFSGRDVHLLYRWHLIEP